MPFLSIREPNTQSQLEFFYQDSGAPLDRQVYTTLVVVHGLCFHSATFQHVVPLATSKGFRMVCLNRRDYPGTTLYSPVEIKALSQGNADEHAALLKTRGEELAEFLYGLIDALSLPGPTGDGKEGGLALMGWSLGNIFTLGTVASVSTLRPQVRDRLQSYLRKSIMLDPPSQALGFSSTSAFFTRDQNLPPKERWTRFMRWTSSYFSHGDLSTRNVDNISVTAPDMSKRSIAASLSLQELSCLIDYETAQRSDAFYLKFQKVLFDQMQKALFNPETRSLWPILDMWLLYCDSGSGNGIYSAWEVEKLAQEKEDQPVKILALENAHHLVFWDDPKKAMDAFDHCLRH